MARIVIHVLDDEAQPIARPTVLKNIALSVAKLAEGAAVEAILGAQTCGLMSDGIVWGQHPKFPRADWAHEVCNGDTNLGYWSWVSLKKELAA